MNLFCLKITSLQVTFKMTHYCISNFISQARGHLIEGAVFFVTVRIRHKHLDYCSVFFLITVLQQKIVTMTVPEVI